MALTYRNRDVEAQVTAAEVEAAGGHAITLPLDLSNPQSIADAVAAAERDLGGIEVLVNNAYLA